MTKRRGRGEGAIYRRESDGLWCSVLSLGVDPITGRRRRRTLYGKTKREVRERLLDAQRAQRDGTLVVHTKTVGQWLGYWHTVVAPERVRPSTLRGYDAWIRRMTPLIGRLPLEQLRPEHVRGMYSVLRADGLGESSVRQCHAILRRALVVAQREGKVSRNVCDLIDPPSGSGRHRLPLTLDQARAVLDASAGDPLEARWWLALWLGMRQGEVLGLQWRHVDLAAGLISVEQAVQRQTGKGVVVVPPKSPSSVRVIPMPTSVMARLHVLVARRSPFRCGSHDFVFQAESGFANRPIDPRRDHEAWTALLVRAGVPHAPLHAARTTAATLMLDAGVDAKLISEILGHAKVSMTRDVYQRGSDDMHRRAVQSLDGLLTTRRIEGVADGGSGE